MREEAHQRFKKYQKKYIGVFYRLIALTAILLFVQYYLLFSALIPIGVSVCFALLYYVEKIEREKENDK
jgi:hypothetical protein